MWYPHFLQIWSKLWSEIDPLCVTGLHNCMHSFGNYRYKFTESYELVAEGPWQDVVIEADSSELAKLADEGSEDTRGFLSHSLMSCL